MSTEFLSSTTGDLGFVRWFAGRDRGACFEFGTVTNWETVVAWVRAGDRFDPLGGFTMDGDPVTAEDFEELVVSGRATFGEFSVTVEVGSGEMARFTLDE